MEGGGGGVLNPLVSLTLSRPVQFPSQPAGFFFCWARKAPLTHVIEILLLGEGVGGGGEGGRRESGDGCVREGASLSMPPEFVQPKCDWLAFGYDEWH